MKRLFIMLAFVASLVGIGMTSAAEAADYWCYSDGYGNSSYVMSETMKYYRGGTAFVKVKDVAADGSLIRIQKWNFQDDEGYDWYSIEDTSTSGRTSQNSKAMAIGAKCYKIANGRWPNPWYGSVQRGQ